MDFNEKQILAPRYWQVFEDLCLELFRREWPDQTAQKNGRTGQPQHGTDIWGMPPSAGGKYHGVQCKGKDVGYGAALTEQEIREEVKKAKDFTPPLAHWIIATTAPKDGTHEQLARELTAEHQTEGLFSVQVLGWGDIQTLLANHLDVVERFYPDQAPHIRQTLKRLEGHLNLEAGVGKLEDAITIGRKAASEDLQKNLRRAGIDSIIELGITRATGTGHEAVERSSFVSSLRGGVSLVLEAEPGAGKSTTLLEVAGKVLSHTADLVPIYLPLPELVAGRKSILEEVASRASFQPVSNAGLRQLAIAGQIVLLCDGWNEVSGEHRANARLELDKHIRDFPASSVLIATRALSPVPYSSSARYFLSPLTRMQQEAILVGRLGVKGSDLLTQARRIPGLRDALQIPLYVSALAATAASGGLPHTKEEVMHRFIETHVQEAQHREALTRVLRERHDAYLRAVAVQLVQAEAVTISEPDLREAFRAVSRELREKGQINTIPEPSDVVEVLASHHVLVERDGSGNKLFSFQHEQFQEWFASFRVEEVLKACSGGSPEVHAQRDEIINSQTWEEPLLFAVERLSRSGDAGAQAVANAILRSVGIDPMLAAEMIQRCTAGVWDLISEPIQTFASAWFRTEEANRAVAFMVATGKPAFADAVWGVLEDGRAYDRVAFRRGHLSPAALGENWKEKMARLPDERRRAVLWDIASGGADGVGFVVEALKDEPSEEIAASVLEIVEYRATDTELATILDVASAEVWQRLAKRRRLDDFPSKFRPRLHEEKKKLAESLPVGVERTRLLVQLGQEDDNTKISEAIDAVLTAKFDDYRSEDHALESLAAAHPEPLSRAIIERLAEGQPLSHAVGRFARASEVSDEAAIRRIAVDAAENNQRSAEIAARLLTAKSARILIDEMLEFGRQLRGAEGRAQEPLRVPYQARADALHLLPLDQLVPAILTTPAKDPGTIAELAELIFRWRNEDRESPTLPLNEPLATLLVERVLDWTTQMLGHPNVKRHHLCELATAIGSIARPELLACVKQLLEKDLSLWRAEREEAAKGRAEGRVTRGSGASMSYVEMYRQAFEAFAGPSVADILLGFLDDPDFASQSGFSLLRFEGKSPPNVREALGRPRYDAIEEARATRAESPNDESPAAKAILDRVDGLIAAGDPASISMASKLATAAAQMNYGKRLQSFHHVLDAPGGMRGRLGLLKALLFSGVEIRPEWVRAGLDETLAALAKDMNHSRDDWWQIREWLELFAFTNSPNEMILRLATLPEHFKREYQVRDLAHIAGFAGEDAIDLLDGLAKQSPALVKNHEWLKAFQRVGTEAAGGYLIDLAFDDSRAGLLKGQVFNMRDVYGRLLRRHPTLVRKLLERLKEPHAKASREFVGRVIGHALDEESVIAFLPLVDSKEDPIKNGLAEAVNELAIAKRPVDGGGGAYEQEPADLSALRERLFQILLNGEDTAGVAATLMRVIDHQRDMFGQPQGEPRHPLIASGKPWPLSGLTAWKALEQREKRE